MASLANQQTAAAIFYAVLGRSPSEYSFKNFGESLETGQYTISSFANFLLTSLKVLLFTKGKVVQILSLKFIRWCMVLRQVQRRSPIF